MDYIEIAYFSDELKNSKSFKGAELFFLRKENWIDSKNDGLIIDRDLISTLNEKPKDALLKKSNYDGTFGYFWLSRNQIVVRLKMKKGTQTQTLTSNLQELKNLQKNAKFAFAANHDSLTGLLNRNGAQSGLERYLQNFNENERDQLEPEKSAV